MRPSRRSQRSYNRAVTSIAPRAAIAIAATCAAVGATTAGTAGAAVRLRTPPVPAGQAASDAYVVRARSPHGPWQRVAVYRVLVDLHDLSYAALAPLEASGPVQIAVTRVAGPMDFVRIRPASAGIEPELSADRRTATFTLTRPGNLSIEPDGNTRKNLHLFVNPLSRTAPRHGRRIVRFGPGVHEIPGDHVLDVNSHTTVEIAAGAVVHGTLRVRRATDVVIRGSGLIDPTRYFDKADGPIGVFVDRSSHVGIDGITILRGQNGGVALSDARDVAIANVKEINADEWSDGIDVAGSRNVLVDGGFFRTSDDTIAVWGTSPWIGSHSTTGMTVRGAVLWPDVAHAVLIGPFGRPGGHDVVGGIDFQDVDVLEQNVDDPLYQGALAVNAGDDLTIRDVRFDGVRIDDLIEGQAVNVRVFENPDYRTTPGTAVRNVLFRDVSVAGGEGVPSEVSGYDVSRTVANVLFDDGNGGRAAGTDVAIGPHATAVAFDTERPSELWDDRDARLRYAHGWVRAGAPPRDVHRASAPGATLQIRFTGRQLRVLGTTSPRGGRFAVGVDGTRRRTVDTYARRTTARQILFDTGPLAQGEHTLTLRVTGTRNVLATGARVAVDAVEVVR